MLFSTQAAFAYLIPAWAYISAFSVVAPKIPHTTSLVTDETQGSN